jgi:hypothetical protein
MTNDTNKIPRPWVQTGRYEFETVCRSTLCPKEWLQVEKIYVCECCLKTTIQATAARRHRVGLISFEILHPFFFLSSSDKMYTNTSTWLFNLCSKRCFYF